MDLKELHSFKMSDAVTFHDNLNPKLFRGQHLWPEVELQLKTIAQDFLQEMGIHDLDVRDITVSGSNAAYSYTDHSDLDLHILVNMDDLPNDEVYREFFKAKKDLYNDSHDITINGIPVELYIQDASEPVVSLGEYSVKDKKWLRMPTKRRSNFDQTSTKAKYIKLLDVIDTALHSNKISKVNKVLKKIKQYRQAGLDKGGEFGPENLAYKALRSRGYITKLYDLRDRLHSKHLSLNGMYANVDEDYNPNGPPPGPEFKPTMPAGTVKVDVSDTYDWYKLGQHISNLDGLGKHDFGQGPPSTIMAFGSEDEEHKYIDALKKTGLTTTDIDPIDPNQPKGMQRQKTDPTYNVNEAVTDNYLYHATMPAGMMRILRTGIIKATDRPQPSTKSKTQYPTISTTRSKQYAESNDFVDFLNLTNDGNSVILVFDRNTVANHYKMFSTSQGTQTVGDEYEEVIVAPKGSMPIKGTLKGFYFNPRRTEEIEGYKDIPWFNELLTSPYYIGPKQGVAEGSLNELAPSPGFGGDDDDDKYTPADYGKPFKANYLGQNKFEVFCRKPQDPSNVIKLNAEVQKYGLEWEDDFGFWFLDSPGAVYLSWKYGEIPLPKAIDQARNPGHIHDLVVDYLTNSPHAAEIQKIATEYFGFTADGEMNEGLAEASGYIPSEKLTIETMYQPINDEVNEAFDKPYKILRWEKGDYGDVDAIARLDDNTFLSIMFNKGYSKDTKEEAWSVEFWRNNSQEVTGEGDSQRVFATVLSAIQTFIKNYTPNKIIFAANKVDDTGQDSQSRVNLYDKLVQRYAKSWGFKSFRADNGNKVIYELSRINKVEEASGYIPSNAQKNDPRFKTALTVDVKPDSIKKNAKAFYWNTSRAGIPPTAKPSGKI